MMRIRQFINGILDEKVSNDNLKVVKERYPSLNLSSEELKYLLSAMKDEPIFFDDEEFYRLLSIQELLDAEEDMNVGFEKIAIIPLIDCGDNDFVSFDSISSKWCKYNIAEEFEFSVKNSLRELFV